MTALFLFPSCDLRRKIMLEEAFRAAGFSAAEITFAQRCALEAVKALSASSMNLEAAATRFVNWTTSSTFRLDVLKPYLAACPSVGDHPAAVADGTSSGSGDQARFVESSQRKNVSASGPPPDETTSVLSQDQRGIVRPRWTRSRAVAAASAARVARAYDGFKISSPGKGGPIELGDVLVRTIDESMLRVYSGRLFSAAAERGLVEQLISWRASQEGYLRVNPDAKVRDIMDDVVFVHMRDKAISFADINKPILPDSMRELSRA
jgi:hypothetical protein